MTAKQNIIEKPFTNDFGTVNVGDTVMLVTTGYSHNVHVKKGTYLGYIESTNSWNQKTEQKVKVAVQESTSEWYFKGSEKKWTWRDGPFEKDKLELRSEPYTRITTLQLNRIAPIKQSEVSTIETVGKLV